MCNIVFNITINVFTSMRTKVLRWFICLTRDQIIVIYGKAYIIIYTSLNDKRVHAMQPETMLICGETATVVMLLCNLHRFVLSWIVVLAQAYHHIGRKWKYQLSGAKLRIAIAIWLKRHFPAFSICCYSANIINCMGTRRYVSFRGAWPDIFLWIIC